MMNKVLFRLAAGVSGMLFGLGMVISGMADPAKVIGFLDVAGEWDPSLIFVMGGALMVFMPAYFFAIRNTSAPVMAHTFCVPDNKRIDANLLRGAALFGVGWGVAGICPGPAVSSLALGNPGVWTFFIAMMVGIGAMHWMLTFKKV
ncbi:hypothetical protein VPR01S_07_01680 [Vibrio proteolyticus NBRC 13287]|uniref:YeeE/YedE family protein n=2 Tax=Vibrio proteolyticus TaxID=671 RepID=U3BL84_VIBPR|nr:hypothetical protein VPR01S_07_01680 [Vibrio proteolyticus NBRC 13287]